MASGYFPIVYANDTWRQKLQRAVDDIGGIVEDWHEDRSTLTPEDAANDQTYIDKLVRAAEVIRECFGVDTLNAAELKAAIAEAEREAELIESRADYYRKSLSKLEAAKILDDAVKAHAT